MIVLEGNGRPEARQRKGRDSAALGLGDFIGRMVVLSRLGQGGMGIVYAAYDLDRKVAVKMLRPDRRPHGLAQQRLLREAQALAKLGRCAEGLTSAKFVGF